MKDFVVKRATQNGVTVREAKWYLEMLTESCKAHGLRRIDAEQMAIDIFDDELAECEFGEKNHFTEFRTQRPRISKKFNDFMNALEEAKMAALKHKDDEDNGTCNFDTPTIRLAGWQKKFVERACRVVGLDCSKWENEYMNYHILRVTDGRGYRRTVMAKAFARAMQKSGYESSVYYQMD